MTAAAQPETAPAPPAPVPIAGPDPLSYVDDAEPYSPETVAILATKVNPELVEVRQPNDLLYVPWIHYQAILFQAFGPGGWRMVPRSVPRQQGNVYTWTGALFVRPPGSKKFQFVKEAVGECNIQSAGNGAEGAQSDCLTKCCKQLGIFMELFDPAWRRWWEGEYKAKHLASKRQHAPVERGRGAGPATPAPAPAVSPAASTSTPRASAGSGGSATAAPPADDVGEPASDESKKALAAEIKRRKWKTAYTVVWLKEHWGVETLGGLSQVEADAALVDVMKRPVPA